MSRKISGSHGQGISSVGASDVAVAKIGPEVDQSASEGVSPIKVGRTRRRAAGTDVGQLLRSAYRQTVEEAVPDDLMDLLNRLE